jgi:type I restriction enzyme R subunit
MVFCTKAGVDLSAIEAASTALERLTLVGDATNALLETDERRKDFVAQARLAERLYSAIKPHKRAIEFGVRMATVSTLAEKIRTETDTREDGPQRGAEAHRTGARRLDRGRRDHSRDGPPAIDLSRIDFKALSKRFKTVAKTKNLDLERLKATMRAQLDRLIAANKTRVDLREKFEALIEEYNAGSAQIEQLFAEELLKLSRQLTDEEARHGPREPDRGRTHRV